MENHNMETILCYLILVLNKHFNGPWTVSSETTRWPLSLSQLGILFEDIQWWSAVQDARSAVMVVLRVTDR